MQTLVKVKNEEYGFTFRTFYGRWQLKHALDFTNMIKIRGIKTEIL